MIKRKFNQMKKYFAKYIPVEGKVKEGDMTFIPRTGELFENTAVYGGSVWCENVFSEPLRNCKKCKLFLCSSVSEVEKGQKFIDLDDAISTIYTCHISGIKKENLALVIGEISPAATWVKEGDEFDEDEVYRQPSRNPNHKVFEIKGQCGHYH